MRHVLTLAAALVVATGCQVYEFNPVQPLAISQTTQTKLVFSKTLKPNLMLLVDKSGSMTTVDVPGEPSRIDALKNAMNGFLTNHGSVARMGLVTFPVSGGDGCGASNAVAAQLPAPSEADTDATAAENQAKATEINNKIQSGMVPTGGTPTNFSLQFVSQVPGLNDPNDRRDDYVLLLTDGLPNCNRQAPVTCGVGGTCRCTLGAAGCNTTGGCPVGCLDNVGVVGAVRSLFAKNIKTIVVGFGAALDPNDSTGEAADAIEVLNAMAEAGGFKRECKVNADCGSTAQDVCVGAALCNRQFYSAQNGTELETALTGILDRVVAKNVCELELETIPESESYISVLVNEEVQLPGAETWKLDGARLIFQGALCRRFQTALDISPLSLEVRAVDVL